MQRAKDKLNSQNRRLARQKWGKQLSNLLETLNSFSRDFGFSVSSGGLVLLNEHWYVTHVGLIKLARRKRCSGILAEPEQEFCNPNEAHWAFRATVYKSPTCRGFVGFGDANPSNVPLSFVAPRCGWLKPGQSIEPCAKLMASGFAP
ncbi:MAG: hypothetical protein JST28_24275 [Acidobacteria bacterium]|nr:hypothetical protein [Acidobacteriota bacterium]